MTSAISNRAEYIIAWIQYYAAQDLYFLILQFFYEEECKYCKFCLFLVYNESSKTAANDNNVSNETENQQIGEGHSSVSPTNTRQHHLQFPPYPMPHTSLESLKILESLKYFFAKIDEIQFFTCTLNFVFTIVKNSTKYQ